MQTVAIVGVGLIGGSFGLALKSAGFQGEVIGVSSPASIQSALERGAIDRAACFSEAVLEADLVYLALPISGILNSLRQLRDLVREDALITDCGSTKQVIVECARKYLRRGTFLPGHPLAGKESRGVEHADAGIFRGRAYALTPISPEDLDTAPALNFREWLKRIGAREVILGAGEHDHIVALSSHLPQLAATALASTLAQSGEDVAELAGPGLLGATRLALSSYDVWRDILATNVEPVTEALTAYIQRLEDIRENLRTLVVQEEFARASAFAGTLLSHSTNS